MVDYRSVLEIPVATYHMTLGEGAAQPLRRMFNIHSCIGIGGVIVGQDNVSPEELLQSVKTGLALLSPLEMLALCGELSEWADDVCICLSVSGLMYGAQNCTVCRKLFAADLSSGAGQAWMVST